jgi:hypothetical protein
MYKVSPISEPYPLISDIAVNGVPVIALEMHADWITLANAQAPLTLKNVVVQETEGFVPIAEASEVRLFLRFMSDLPLHTDPRIRVR